MLLHGVQHDLTINSVASLEGNNVMIHSNFVIPYVEWGLEDPSVLMFKVSKDVAVDVTTVARLSWNVPASAPDPINSANPPRTFSWPWLVLGVPRPGVEPGLEVPETSVMSFSLPGRYRGRQTQKVPQPRRSNKRLR